MRTQENAVSDRSSPSDPSRRGLLSGLLAAPALAATIQPSNALIGRSGPRSRANVTSGTNRLNAEVGCGSKAALSSRHTLGRVVFRKRTSPRSGLRSARVRRRLRRLAGPKSGLPPKDEVECRTSQETIGDFQRTDINPPLEIFRLWRHQDKILLRKSRTLTVPGRQMGVFENKRRLDDNAIYAETRRRRAGAISCGELPWVSEQKSWQLSFC